MIGNDKGSQNRRASHPLNAMLNYAYAVLESQVRMQVIADGYDPKIGFLHAHKAGRDAFVLDLMEPMRPIVDRAILRLVQSHKFCPSDFLIRKDGVCRLNPEMSRHVAKLTLAQISISRDLTANASFLVEGRNGLPHMKGPQPT